MNETFYKRDLPFSIAFLADTHNTSPFQILKSLRNNHPDIILFAGDFVRGELSIKSSSKLKDSQNTLELLCGCSKIAPTFVSMGNHERSLIEEDFDILTNIGVFILDNSWIKYHDVFIGGLSSAYFTEYKKLREKGIIIRGIQNHIPYTLKEKPLPETSWLKDFSKLPGKKILLCHHPEYYPKYIQSSNIDLILSGHCHGGQWRYYSPFHKEWRGVYAPGQGLFPSLTAGIYDDRLVISRGLSNTTIIPRINNPTEIIYFNILPGK